MAEVIMFLTFLRVATSWSFIAIVQRVSSTAPASGSLGLEPRLPPARDHAASLMLQARHYQLGNMSRCRG